MINYNIFNRFPHLTAFTTTRKGGVSKGLFGSFNLSPFTGDNPENFYQNLELLSGKINIPDQKIFIPFQTHGTELCVIDMDFMFLSKYEQNQKLQGIDALITNLNDVCIGVTTADCVPVFLFDSVRNVVAVAHAGWRGTKDKIVTNTIKEMISVYRTDPENLFAVIGPSISGDAYSVGQDVYEAFASSSFPVDEIFHENDTQIYLDLWKANKFLLLSAGVPECQIEVSGRCTYAEPDFFFSARRDGIKSGRLYSGLSLKM